MSHYLARTALPIVVEDRGCYGCKCACNRRGENQLDTPAHFTEQAMVTGLMMQHFSGMLSTVLEKIMKRVSASSSDRDQHARLLHELCLKTVPLLNRETTGTVVTNARSDMSRPKTNSLY